MKRAKTLRNDRAITDTRAATDAHASPNHAPERVRLTLDRHNRTPFYRQIYQRFRDAIAQGILRPGERLPSSRTLASQLSTSRGTIDLAYSLLSVEGLVASHGAAGTVVARAPSLLKPSPKPPALPKRRWLAQSGIVGCRPFQMGLPALDAFPAKLWSRLAIRHARNIKVHELSVPSPSGYLPLREAIRSYLAVSRGILCSSEQVIITRGFQGALGMIAHAFLAPGDEVWFEDPGFFMARLALEASGAKPVPVPVDDEGLDVSAALARSPRARLAYVTPSHQAPLGVALGPRRRIDLLSWAAAENAWIIEDDYDSEFRYGSPPLPALKSVDEAGRVLYIGTFSKVLFPGLRLGYMVVPESQIDRLAQIYQLLYMDRTIFDQAITADFMIEAHFARHIRRMRALYSERRAALAAALSQVFAGQMSVQLQAGGMHLLARIDARVSGCKGAAGYKDDRALAARAEAQGLAPAPLSLWAMEYADRQGLLLSFTNIPVHAALDVAKRLKLSFDTP
jgi:GntR family transcriptional regulator / MocR family aminotransferase